MIIQGVARLGKEPKMSFTPKGAAQTYLTLAFDCGFGDKKETIWVGAWAYGAQAEFVNKYFQKGSRIEVCLEATGLYTYAKDDGVTGGSVNARVLTAKFVDKGTAKKEGTPFDDDVVEIEEF